MMPMNTERENKVAEFVEAAGKQPFVEGEPVDGSILSCLREEVDEFVVAFWEYMEALEDPEANTETFRANLVKEWADMQYVVSQAAWYLDISGITAFNRVHNSNMTKVVDGVVTLRTDGKIMKPPGYKAPDMRGL